MKFEGGLVLLRESLAYLAPAEKKIARFILSQPEKAVTLNISQLAKACRSSTASVARLCKRLMFKGFGEFKLRIASDMSRNFDSRRLHLGGASSPEEICDLIVQSSIDALRNIPSIIDLNSVNAAVDRMLVSRRIDIYGVGASGIVAQDLFQKLVRIGLCCSYSLDSHIQITSACTLKGEDTAIAISYSGQTDAVISAAEAAKRSKAVLIGITSLGANRLSSICDINLFMPSSEPLVRQGAMTSRITQLAVVDILFSMILSRSRSRFFGKLLRTAETLGKTKSSGYDSEKGSRDGRR